MDKTEASKEARGVRLTIPSNTEFVRVVRLAVLGVASRMSFTFEQIEDIKLAVSEACNNAILHGGTPSAPAGDEAFVEISVTPYPDRIEIEVADNGRVAAPGLLARNPHAGARDGANDEELRESGLGLFLMESMMDKVEHETSADSNTVVRMTKYLNPSDAV